eukprot:2141298-Rhodomonas_salina.3
MSGTHAGYDPRWSAAITWTSTQVSLSGTVVQCEIKGKKVHVFIITCQCRPGAWFPVFDSQNGGPFLAFDFSGWE